MGVSGGDGGFCGFGLDERVGSAAGGMDGNVQYGGEWYLCRSVINKRVGLNVCVKRHL